MAINKQEIMALDVGSVRIGVARANLIARIAEPIAIVNGADEKCIDLFGLIAKHNPSKIVVGVPRNMSGQETKQSAEIRAWAEGIKPKLEALEISMVYWDETLSSVDARERSDAKHVDDYAAAIILESYLEQN